MSKIKNDDFSCDPRKWSIEKLCTEYKNGMPAVVEEYTRRLNNIPDHVKVDL